MMTSEALSTHRKRRTGAVALGARCVAAGLTACGMTTLPFSAGCASAPRAGESTRLLTQDFRAVVTEMSQKLASSDWLRDRTRDSSPIIITVRSIENLSSDLISEGERWYQMERVCDALSESAALRERAITMVVPVERRRRMAEEGAASGMRAGSARATHEMTAQILSTRRRSGDMREEFYFWRYTVNEIASGEVVWSGSFEMERAARGDSWN